MTVVAVLLKSSTTGVVAFHTADQVAMVGLGLALGAGVLWVSRPRVDADAEGVGVRNIVGSYRLPWTFVRAVRFDRHSPWASLLLTNGEEVAVLAVQAADKQRALDAVQGLRALHAAAVPAEDPSTRTQLLYE
ncbi:PH domain-containing protein [Modestobacter sp. DSM 44400]|uniref:PH domain-containing protein n=1 Tax=Modestobacter sp. DSM 44400 TaxID=1550230 RepID=UPI000B830B4B|nr:PH domain-containing protein [Modestobacter sp. DSM 44400]